MENYKLTHENGDIISTFNALMDATIYIRRNNLTNWKIVPYEVEEGQNIKQVIEIDYSQKERA
jgi:hypothetical protein